MELDNLFPSPNIFMVTSKKDDTGHIAYARKIRNAHKVLVRKPKKKKRFRKYRHR
jgi:hypothetical protein